MDLVTPIASMPGCARVTIDRAVQQTAEAAGADLLGLRYFRLFRIVSRIPLAGRVVIERD